MDRPISIFVDAHVFDELPQGTVTYLVGLYREIAKDDRFEIMLAAASRTRTEELMGDVPFSFYKYEKKNKFLRLLYEIPRVVKDNAIDYVHFQYICSPFVSCKVINTIHDLLFVDHPKLFPWKYRVKNRILFYLSALRSDIICTVSGYSADAIEKHFRIPRKDIVITPNAVNMVRNADGNCVSELKSKKFILLVSRIEPRKRQLDLLRTWRELGLADQGYYLVIVGKLYVEYPEFVDEVESLSADERRYFKMYDRVASNETVAWLYSNCSLFVYPSEAEGFGIPPLEAAVCGAKVICSNQTAMSDFSFFSDYLFDPTVQGEMKRLILLTLECDYPHREIERQITSRFSWHRSAELLINRLLTNDEK
ncbi:glycosyltransferase family 4 protein [Desulfosediminicola flagellatus]|uniref:glycosyltransferase family 4 protein n=1 Tax=Desulfosediminicola flagellatus TaxID=2569541 RepID=UPI0010ACCCC5|nr:glycosyltransferase family 1 protein [Desulfosediminicola flagellatus]